MSRMRLAQPVSVGPEEVFILVGDDGVAAEKICKYMNTPEAWWVRHQRFKQLARMGQMHHLEFNDVWQEVVNNAIYPGWGRPNGHDIPVRLVRLSDNAELDLRFYLKDEAVLVNRTTKEETPCLRVLQDAEGVIYGVVEAKP